MDWISVKERMPEENGYYLVKVGSAHKPIRVYAFNPSDWHKYENLWKDEAGAYCFNHFVTHWMPLPELPKEDAE